MAAMDKLVKLMQLQKMMDDSAYRKQKYNYDMGQDQITNRYNSERLRLEGLLREQQTNAAKAKAAKEEGISEFNSDAATYIPRIMADNAGNRGEFLQDVGEFAGGYSQVPEDFLKDSLSDYDLVNGNPNKYTTRPSDLSRLTDQWRLANPNASPSQVYNQMEKIKTLAHNAEIRGAEQKAITEAKENTENFYKLYTGLNEKAQEAIRSNYKVDQMLSLASEFDTGPGSNLVLKGQEIADMFGWDVDWRGDMTPKQVLRALTTQMKLDLRDPKGPYGGGAPGSLTEKEWGYLEEGIINAETTGEGIKMLGDIMKSNANSIIGMQQAISKSGTTDYQEAIDVRDKYLKDNPYKIRKTSDYEGGYTQADYSRAIKALGRGKDIGQKEYDAWLRENTK